MIVILELVNILVAGGLGMIFALKSKDIVENANIRAFLSIPLETNYWIDLGQNIMRYVNLNMELIVNVSRFGNLQGLLNYI